MRLPLVRLPLVLMLSWTVQVFASDPAKGRETYQHQCLGCHGSRGEGLTPDMPSFNRGDGLWVSDSRLLERIENGKNGCPPYNGVLNRQKIFDVISYLRTLQ